MSEVSSARHHPDHDLGPEDFPDVDWAQAEPVEANPDVDIVLDVPITGSQLDRLRELADHGDDDPISAVQALIRDRVGEQLRTAANSQRLGSAKTQTVADAARQDSAARQARSLDAVVLSRDLDDHLYTSQLAEAIRHRRPIVLVQADGTQQRLDPQPGLLGLALRTLALVTLGLQRTGERLSGRTVHTASADDHFLVPPVGFAGWVPSARHERAPV